jgi:hypothetical protein
MPKEKLYLAKCEHYPNTVVDIHQKTVLEIRARNKVIANAIARMYAEGRPYELNRNS